MKKNPSIYRSIHLGNNDAAVKLLEDLACLSMAVDINISQETRQFFRELVEKHREEIDNFKEWRNHV